MSRDEIFAVVKANIEVVIEGARGKEISEAMSMRDYGADSLEMVEVVSRSMKQLKIRVPRTDLADAENLGDLLDILEQHAAKAATAI